MSSRVLTAERDDETLFACIVEGTRETAPSVSSRRLSAFLRPFRSEGEARVALANAGGENIQEVRR